MATLILTAVGSAIGGPIGGAIGAAIGQQFDQSVFKPKSREGPRLQELAVQTSSYGNQIPAIFGTMRVAGTVIWATDLVERRAKNSGGKGRPSTVTYSYSVSLCVALSSRPILRIGRIWADGNLLRGEAGDLKFDTQLRVYTGNADQLPDPLIASAESAGRCPAHRGLAYVVFEDLQLADFGNRIPSLTFEIFERDGVVPVNAIFKAATAERVSAGSGQAIAGFALSGAAARDPLLPLMETLSIELGTRDGRLAIRDSGGLSSGVYDVDALTAENESRFEAPRQIAERSSATPDILGLRYYDLDRDFLASVQQSQHGDVVRGTEQIELPAVLTAAQAKQIIHVRHSQLWNGKRRWLADVANGTDRLAPGDEVADAAGKRWQIEQIEHRFGSAGISARAANTQATSSDQSLVDPGRNIASPDVTIGETRIALIDLPAFGTEDPGSGLLAVFAAGTGPGWRRAALSRRLGDQLTDVGVTAAPAIMGTSLNQLATHNVNLIDEGEGLRVQLLNSGVVMPERFGSPLDFDAPIFWLGGEFIRFGWC